MRGAAVDGGVWGYGRWRGSANSVWGFARTMQARPVECDRAFLHKPWPNADQPPSAHPGGAERVARGWCSGIAAGARPRAP